MSWQGQFSIVCGFKEKDRLFNVKRFRQI
jgi:hypothetical protein